MLKFPAYQSIRQLFAGLLLLILGCGSALASMGLGEARIESFLGQPLVVRISLLDPSPEALDSFGVDIASAEDHARLGVPIDALALNLNVEVDASVEPPVLMVRSARPVAEPLLQLLISARWSGGRMLREYTLFLDPVTAPVAPPVRRMESSEPASRPRSDPWDLAPPESQPQAEASEGQPTPAPQPAPEPETSATDLVSLPSIQHETMTVLAGQTLWAIASDWRTDDSVSMSQVMLAIQERNPDAFMGANINRLRRGAQLVRPDMASMRAVRPDEAELRVRDQHRAWRADQPRIAPPPQPMVETPLIDETPQPEPAPEPDPPAESDLTPSAAPEAEPEAAITPETEIQDLVEAPELLPRLELIAAEEELLADADALGAERDRLQQELDVLLENLQADGLGTAQADSAVDQIRQAIESGDAGGLMVASEGLASLEQQLREQRLAREQAEAERAATPAPPPAEIPTDDLGRGRPAWMLPLIGGVALLLLMALIVVGPARRRRSREEAAQPRSAAAVSSPAREPSLESMGATVNEPAPEPEPKDRVDQGLAALYTAAEDENFDSLSSAFSQLRQQVDSTDDPRWLEAVTLVKLLIPDHPLLGNASELDAASGSTEMDSEDGELIAMLDSTDDNEPVALEDFDFTADERPDKTPDQAVDDGHPDLARVTNRLDPGESGTADAERSASEREASLRESMPEPEPKSNPLDLDFDFSTVDNSPALEPDPSAPEPDEPESQPRADASDLQLSSDWSPDADEPGAEDDSQSWFDLTQVDSEDADLADESDDETIGLDAEAMGEGDDPAGALTDDDAEVKLDLARAYLSMDDWDSARSLLEEVQAEGSPTHRSIAQQLLDKLK